MRRFKIEYGLDATASFLFTQTWEDVSDLSNSAYQKTIWRILT